jgi:O-antigen/teichoic acid export membrane protein
VSSVFDSIGELFKSAGIMFVGTVVANVLALLGEIIIPRALAPATYGRLGLSFSIISAISTLAILGVPNGITRFLSAEDSEHHQLDILQAGYGLSIVGVVVVAVVIYVTRFEIAGLMNDPQIAPLLVSFLPYLLAFPVAKVSVGVLRAQERTLAVVLAERILPRLIGLALVVSLVIAGKPMLGAIGYWLSFSVIGAVLALYFAHQRIDILSALAQLPERETARALWSFSWPLAAAASLHIVLSNIDLVMLGYFTDSTTVGYYRVIQPLKQVIFFFTGSFAFLYLPIASKHYSKGHLDSLDTLYTVTTKWIVSLTFPPILVLVLFSPDVIRVSFGVPYLPAAPALSVLMAGLFYRVLVGINGDMVKAIDRPRIELFSALVGVVVDVILNAALIPRFGIVGAALGTVVAYFAYNSIEVVAIYYVVGSYPFSAAVFKPLVPTTLFGIGILALTSQLTLGLFALVSLCIGLYVAHLVSMVLTRSFTDTDLIIIKQFETRFDIDLSWLSNLIRG